MASRQKPDPPPLTAGTRIGRYEIAGLLGEGGMGTVYEALHDDLRKRVAIKVLHPHLAADDEARIRFLREGQAAARIRHPHVVDVSDVGWEEGLPFLVMEHLAGEDLAALLAREGKLGVEQTVAILLPVIAGVAAGHQQGVIHRDLKPQNILLARTPDGEIAPKVLDFGVSKLLDLQGSSIVTRAGAVFGTAQYMSPEQARADRDIGPASDQYALGAILYQCLTGRAPYSGEGTFDVLRRVVLGELAAPRRLCPELPAALETIILRAMSYAPAGRFPSVSALGRALLPFGSPVCRSRWTAAFAPAGRASPLAARAGLLALAVLGAFALVPLIRVQQRSMAAPNTVIAIAGVPRTEICGSETPDLSSIRNVDGLAIDRRGTIYFSQMDGENGWVGRLRPGGAAPELHFVEVPLGFAIWGIAVDTNRATVYVASESGRAIHAIDLRASPPRLRDLVSGVDKVNDLALDFEGNLYYSQQRDRHIFRVTPGGQVSTVTADPLVDGSGGRLLPAGVAFGPEGDLYVGTDAGPLLRLTLVGGREVSRRRFGDLSLWGASLAFDVRGRLYASEYWPGKRSVFSLEPGGSRWTTIGSGTQLTSIAFGRGALDCRDLYFGSLEGPVQRVRTDHPGLPLP